MVMVNYIGLQTDARYWDSPTTYDPSRFLGELPAGSDSAYIPFGVGPRTCVGANMGNLEGVSILVMILQKYRLEARERRPGTQLRITIQVRGGPQIRIRRRSAPEVPGGVCDGDG